MRDVHPRQVEFYCTSDGQEPFSEWLLSIQDQSTQDRILGRLERLESGNLGNYRSVGSGVFELRLDFGPGYRIYFGQVQLFCCSVAVTNPHRGAILSVQKLIG